MGGKADNVPAPVEIDHVDEKAQLPVGGVELVSALVTHDDQGTVSVLSGFRNMVANPFVLGVTIFASIGGFLFGYDQGAMSSILVMESFGAAFPRAYMDSAFKGWLVSSLLLAAWFGSLVNGVPTDRIGRKRSILVSTVIFVVGAALQAGARNVAMIIAGRVVAGLAVGALTHVVPLYLAEIAPAAVRGSLVAIQQLSITIGILVAYWIEYGTSHIGGVVCAPGTPYTGPVSNGQPTFDPYHDVPAGGCTGQSDASWRFPLAFQILPALILGVGTFFLPYSPRWLADKGRDDEALRVLSRLRRQPPTHPAVLQEWYEVRAVARYERMLSTERYAGVTDGGFMAKAWVAKYVELLTVKSNFKRVFIGSAIMFFQQFIGCNAIIYYAPTIFQQVGMNATTTSVLATGVYGIVNTVSTLPAVLFLDVWGRKNLLMTGAFGTMCSLLIVGGIVGGYKTNLSEHPMAAHVAIAFIYIYDVFFSFSWAPIGWVLPSEIFSLRTRAPAISVTTSSTWMSNFIIGLVTPRMLATIGFGTYIFFAAFALIAFFFTLFLVPETKGRSLEEMAVVFGGSAEEAKAESEELGQIIRKLMDERVQRHEGSA